MVEKRPKKLGFVDHLGFRLMQASYARLEEMSPTDYQHWSERGWLDTKTRYFHDNVRRNGFLDARIVDAPVVNDDDLDGLVARMLIVECVRGLGATALSITHDMISARRIADRVAMLHEGRIIWTGPVATIDSSGNDYVEQFIHGKAEGPIQMQVRR